jgi:hypothetical protein
MSSLKYNGWRNVGEAKLWLNETQWLNEMTG